MPLPGQALLWALSSSTNTFFSRNLSSSFLPSHQFTSLLCTAQKLLSYPLDYLQELSLQNLCLFFIAATQQLALMALCSIIFGWNVSGPASFLSSLMWISLSLKCIQGPLSVNPPEKLGNQSEEKITVSFRTLQVSSAQWKKLLKLFLPAGWPSSQFCH